MAIKNKQIVEIASSIAMSLKMRNIYKLELAMPKNKSLYSVSTLILMLLLPDDSYQKQPTLSTISSESSEKILIFETNIVFSSSFLKINTQLQNI